MPKTTPQAAHETRGQSRRTVTLQIAGAKYRMVSDADEAYLGRLAQAVNKRLQSLSAKTPMPNQAQLTQLLVMVSLTFADELENAKRQLQKLETHLSKNVEREVQEVMRRIDRTMASLNKVYQSAHSEKSAKVETVDRPHH